MFVKKKEKQVAEQQIEKPVPAYLRPDYPYQAVGEAITDLSVLEDGLVYEIKCPACEMSIRSQGQNIIQTYERIKTSGCIGCGNKNLVIKKVDVRKD